MSDKGIGLLAAAITEADAKLAGATDARQDADRRHRATGAELDRAISAEAFAANELMTLKRALALVNGEAPAPTVTKARQPRRDIAALVYDAIRARLEVKPINQREIVDYLYGTLGVRRTAILRAIGLLSKAGKIAFHQDGWISLSATFVARPEDYPSATESADADAAGPMLEMPAFLHRERETA